MPKPDVVSIEAERYVLGLFTEEAGEVLQWCGKSLRFGFDTPGRRDPVSGDVTGETPRGLMPPELGDFLAAIDFAVAHGFVDMAAVEEARRSKLAKLLNPTSLDNLGRPLAPQPATRAALAAPSKTASKTASKIAPMVSVKALELAGRVKEAAETADKVLGGPEGETILGYTIPTGKWLMLQADLRNFLERLAAPLPNPEADELREALKPFADLYIGVSMNDDANAAHTVLGTEADKRSITAGDVRRARAALTKETANVK